MFTATYNQGTDKSLALFWFDYTVAAKCLKLVVVNSSGSHHTTIFLYKTERKTFRGSLSGPPLHSLHYTVSALTRAHLTPASTLRLH